MWVYLGLVIYLLFFPVIIQNFVCSKEKADRISLVFCLMVLFLISILRSTTIGRDIDGYELMYSQYSRATWNNFDLYWTENGFELLQMIFVRVLKLPFRALMIFIYALLFFSYYCFLKKYSVDSTFSLFIYLTFSFFFFDLSALRSCLAMAICLLAIPLAEKKGIRNFLLFLCLILLASQFHSSAYIFLMLYFVIKIPLNRKTIVIYTVSAVTIFLLRSRLYGIINTFFKQVDNLGNLVGGTTIFYVLILLFSACVIFLYNQGNGIVKNNGRGVLADNCGLQMSISMTFVSIVLQIFASGTILVRLAEYTQIFVLLLLPNVLSLLDNESRKIAKAFLIVLFLIYFWYYCLASDPMGVVPYVFFFSSTF